MIKIVPKNIIVNILFYIFEKQNEKSQVWRSISSSLLIKNTFLGNLSTIVNTITNIWIRNNVSINKGILFEYPPIKVHESLF